jgi:hypothetical protein
VTGGSAEQRFGQVGVPSSVVLRHFEHVKNVRKYTCCIQKINMAASYRLDNLEYQSCFQRVRVHSVVRITQHWTSLPLASCVWT